MDAKKSELICRLCDEFVTTLNASESNANLARNIICSYCGWLADKGYNIVSDSCETEQEAQAEETAVSERKPLGDMTLNEIRALKNGIRADIEGKIADTLSRFERKYDKKVSVTAQSERLSVKTDWGDKYMSGVKVNVDVCISDDDMTL